MQIISIIKLSLKISAKMKRRFGLLLAQQCMSPTVHNNNRPFQRESTFHNRRELVLANLSTNITLSICPSFSLSRSLSPPVSSIGNAFTAHYFISAFIINLSLLNDRPCLFCCCEFLFFSFFFLCVLYFDCAECHFAHFIGERSITGANNTLRPI